MTDNYPPVFGGMARSAHRVVNNLILSAPLFINQKVSIRVLTISNIDEIIISKPTIIRIKKKKKERDTLHTMKMVLEEMILEERPDLIIGFYIHYSAYVTTFMGKLYNISTIISARGNDIERGLFDPSRISMVNYCLINCTHFTSVSKYLVDMATSNINGIEQKYTVVNNGINIKKFNTPKYAKGRFVVGFFGDSREKKGIDVLIQSIALLVSISEKKWKFILGGKISPEIKTKLPNILAVKRIEKFDTDGIDKLIVKTVGKVNSDDIDSFYNQIHCLIIPSLYDGLPNVLLEAVIRGIPVVISDTPSLSEYFPRRLIPRFISKNYQDLTRVIKDVRDNYMEFKNKISEAREYLINNYSNEKEIEKWFTAINITKT